MQTKVTMRSTELTQADAQRGTEENCRLRPTVNLSKYVNCGLHTLSFLIVYYHIHIRKQVCIQNEFKREKEL